MILQRMKLDFPHIELCMRYTELIIDAMWQAIAGPFVFQTAIATSTEVVYAEVPWPTVAAQSVFVNWELCKAIKKQLKTNVDADFDQTHDAIRYPLEESALQVNFTLGNISLENFNSSSKKLLPPKPVY